MTTSRRKAILYGDTVPNPVNAGDVVPKSYVDGLVAGAAIADGTYGDIVISGTVTVFTVGAGAIGTSKLAAKAVTYSKIQDVTGGNVVLGRVSGAGQVEEVPCTSVGRALMAAANAAAQRTALGLVIGSDIQAYRAYLAKVGLAGSSLASAGTVTLASSVGDYLVISGTTTITSFGTGAPYGSEYTILFAASLTVTHSASLVLPSGANIVTQANDIMVVRAAMTDGTWRCVSYQRASGLPLYNDPELAALAGLTSAADKVPYFTGSGTAALADMSAAGRALIDDANAAAQRATLGLTDGGLEIRIDGGGAAIATGINCDTVVPYACTITSATLLADQAGSIVIELWKDTYANFPPTVGDKITASAPPTLSAAAKSQDTTLTGWTVSLAKGDIIRANVNSASTVQRVTLYLAVTK